MAPVLDYIFVTASVENDEVLTVIIPRDAAGVSIDESWDMLAMRGTASHTLVMKDVRIPISYVLKASSALEQQKAGCCIFRLVILAWLPPRGHLQ